MRDGGMADLLDRAVATALTLPPDMQDDIAPMVLRYAGEDQPALELTPDEAASFAGSRSQASRREFASDERVRAVQGP